MLLKGSLGAVSLDLNDLDRLTERDSFPVLIKGFESVDSLAEFNRRLARVIVGSGSEHIADAVPSGRGDSLDPLSQFFGDDARAFVAIKAKGERLIRYSGDTAIDVDYLMIVVASNDHAELYFTSPRTLSYYPNTGKFKATNKSVYDLRPGRDHVLRALQTSKKTP